MKNTLKLSSLCMLFLSSAMTASAQIKVQAEDFKAAKNGKSEIVLENNGASIGYFDEVGEVLTYEVNIPTTGLYQISFKYLAGKAGSLRIETADGAYSIFSTQAYNTSGKWWELPMNNWPAFPMEESALFYFESGKQMFKAVNRGTGLNIDYFELKQASSSDAKVASIKTVPNKVVLMPNESQEILPYAYNSENMLLASTVEWSSNANDGVYKAGKSETADVITVTMGGVEKTVNVKVANPTKKQEFVVTKHGKLNTQNGAVRDQNGQKVSLMGPSFFWSCSAPLWWTKETVNYLVSKYNVQIVRLPVSIAPGDNTWIDHSATWNEDNYLHSPEYTRAMVDEVVKAAIENDIYVIIDFHEHHAEHWVDLANDFFTYFATKWGEFPNVMYEIYNEPMTDNGTVVEYAKKVIPTIRAIDDDNIIIVGSTQYSREPGNVTAAGQGYSNIAYTWHGYVEWGHQGDWNNAGSWNNGVPIVVTEWGLDWSKRDGGLLNIYKERSLINCFWSMSNKGGDDAKWSILKDDVYKTSDWSDSDMTENGAYLLGIAKNWVNYKPTVFEGMADLTMSVSNDMVFFLPQNETQLSAMAAGGTGNYAYKWVIASGPQGAQLSADNTASVKISNMGVGTYLISVTVSDGEDEINRRIKIVVFPEGYVDPGLIDDVEDNDVISLLGGKWSSFDDSDKKANVHSSITNAAQLPSNGAIKADFKMGDMWQGDGWTSDPYCGVRLSMAVDDSPVDLTPCQKISYRYKGAAHSFRVEMASQPDDDFYSINVSASDEWKTATISWGSLKQDASWGEDVDLDQTDISKFSWQMKGQQLGAGTLMIDDVTCEGSDFVTSTPDVAEAEASFSIYPNPAVGGHATLHVTDRVKVEIFSVSGCLEKSFMAIPYFDNEINFAKEGVYFVKVGTSVQKLIVQ